MEQKTQSGGSLGIKRAGEWLRVSKGRILWWAIIGVVAVVFGFGAQTLAIPGGWLVAALIVAIVAGLIRPAHPRVDTRFLAGAQAVIGTMLGAAFRPEVIPDIAHHALAVVLVLVVTIGASVLAGIVLGRVSPIGRETATLGTLPGGASAMISISVDSGADTRTVALMQYLRMVVVVLSASAVSKIFGAVPGGGAAGSAASLFGGSGVHHWFDYALTPLVAIVGGWGGRRIRLPTGAFLGPIILSLLCSGFHLFNPVWPSVVPEAAYIVMGFYVGLLFDRESLLRAGKLIPIMVLNTFVLIGICALSGMLFAKSSGTDLLSGYLATSPGGMDSIAVIAIGSGADISLVLSVQTLRLLVIIFIGPLIARSIIKSAKKRSSQ